MVLMINLTKMD